MFEASYDASKNRIYVKIEGLMGMEEAKEYAAAVSACVNQAKEGYTFCIDMTNAQAVSVEVNDSLAAVRGQMAQKKTKRSAMIVSNTLTKLQLTRMIKEIGGAYNVSHSLADAERYLDAI